MFNPTRDQVRTFFIEAWRKYREGRPLVGAEAMALDVILLHPEYQAALAEPEKSLAREYHPELGATNPFLHMSLHVALEEQLSIDQPPGVARAFAAIAARCGERHAAVHEAIECLAEMIWRAQRDSAPPDGAAYLECLVARGRAPK